MPDTCGGSEQQAIDRFTRIYRSTFGPVLAYAMRRVPDRDEAFDVVADTFAVVWRRIDSVPEGPREAAWVFGVARRVVANATRSRLRRVRLHGRLHALRAGPDPTRSRHGLEAEAGSVDDQVQVVLAAMGRLPARHQEVLRLAAWEDLSQAEMGEILGCSANAVAIRLHRARRALHEAYRLELARRAVPVPHPAGLAVPRSDGAGPSDTP